MGLFSFLGKKSSAPAASAPSAPAPQPVAQDMPSALPELPSFDQMSTPSAGPSLDLPPLPSFDEISSAPMPSAPSTPSQQDFDLPPLPSSDSLAPSMDMPDMSMPAELPEVSAPPVREQPTAPAAQSPVASAMQPVYCDVETYRTILSNLNYARDEVNQLQGFSDNSRNLHDRMNSQYEAFHTSLSSMAKRMMTAEAKLFR